MQVSTTHPRLLPLPLAIRVSVFHLINRISYLKPSSRLKGLQAVSMAVRGSDCQLAVALQSFLAEVSNWKVLQAAEAYSQYMFPLKTCLSSLPGKRLKPSILTSRCRW